MLKNRIEKIESLFLGSFLRPLNDYTFSSKKLDFLLRIFYCVSLALVIHQFSSRAAGSFWLENPGLEWSWPVAWIDYFESKQLIVFAIFFLTVVFCALSIFFIRSMGLKIISALSFFMLSSIEFSTGRLGHTLHAWLFVFVIFSFIGPDRKRDKFLFHTAQFYLLLTYFLSGFHKITALFIYIKDFGLSLKDLKPVEVSLAARIYDFPWYKTGKIILAELSSWPAPILLALWVGVIYFQVACLFVFYRPPLYRLWGLFIIFFHLITVFLLKVMFFYNMILTAFLFIETPYHIDFSLKKAILNIPGIPSLLKLAKIIKKSGLDLLKKWK